LERFRQEPRAPLPKSIFLGNFGARDTFCRRFFRVILRYPWESDRFDFADFGALRAGWKICGDLIPGRRKKNFSAIGASPAQLGPLSNLSGQLVLFSQEMGGIASSSFNLFVTGAGGPLITDLGRLRNTLGAIDAESDQLSSIASFAGNLSPVGVGSFLIFRLNHD